MNTLGILMNSISMAVNSYVYANNKKETHAALVVLGFWCIELLTNL